MLQGTNKVLEKQISTQVAKISELQVQLNDAKDEITQKDEALFDADSKIDELKEELINL